MILRKPYAFFIKHFKLIHIILAFLMSYSLYRTKSILDFFNQYVSTTIRVIGQDLVGTYMYGAIYLLTISILILLSLILVVMIVKKKPHLFYILSIIIFVYSLIILAITSSTLFTLQETIVDLRVTRLIRDLIMVSFFAQMFCTVIVFIRAIGFDVKKFDFKKDLQELHIEEEDSEEFEVSFNIDKNKTKRKINKTVRFLKYAYKENKLLANIFLAIIIITLGSLIGFRIWTGEKVLNYNQYFSGNGFNLSIVDSYLTDSDYKGHKIDDNYYLVLRVNIKSTDYIDKKINLATMKIVIDKFSYFPDLTKNSLLFDFGNIYNDQNIGSDYQTISLIYSIPHQLIDKNIYFAYVNKLRVGNSKYNSTRVKIDYVDLTNKKESQTYNLKDSITLEEPLNNYTFSIDKMEIAKVFKVNYNYVVDNNVYPSYEYVKPTLSGNENKALLKIEGNFNGGDIKLNNVNTLYDFINNFSYLTYIKNGESFIQKNYFNKVTTKKTLIKNTFYIEVLEDVLNADEIYLTFTIRNKSFDYILK